MRRASSIQKRSPRIERLIAQTEGGASWVGASPLILRAIDDEAALSLAAGALTNRLSWLVFHTAEFVALFLGWIVITTIRFEWAGSIVRWSAPIMVSTAVIICGAAAGLHLSRAVFGREFLFSSRLACEANCQQTPDVNGTIDVITLQDQLSFRHSIHELKEAPQAIANWIAAKSNSNRH